MKYIKEFQNQQEYNKWYLEENYHAPNVVGIGEDPNDLDISMNDDNYLIVKLNITDNEEVDLWKTDDINNIDEIFLDNVKINDITTPLKASDISNGEHILKMKPNNSTLGGHTLFGHKYITYAYIPGVINTIDQGTFYSCTNLKSISLSDNVKNISNGAFSGCSSLNFDKFDHIETIGNGAFNGCKINKIHLTKNIKSIGSGVFSGNPLEEIYMDTPAWDNTRNYYEFSNSALRKVEIGSHCINKETGSLYCTGINGFTLETVILPEGLVNGPNFSGASITKYIKWPSTLQTPASFGGGRVPEIMDLSHTQLTISPCLPGVSGIKTIILPQTVTTMQSCGGGCSVENINIPAGVTSLPSGCFSGCSSLKRIDIQGNLTSIGSGCFGGCSSLESINIPSSLIEYGGLSFGGCVKLGYVENGIRYIDINNLGTEVIQIEDHTLSSYIIKDSVKYMNTYILQQNQIPNCISITWPSGITNIPDSMLKNNTMLETFNIPEGITSIGNETFMNCSNLRSIIIPDTITSIGDNAFAGTKLGYIENGIKYLDTPNNILALSVSDTSLTSYNIKNGTTRIEFSADTWYEAENVRDITLPNSLTYISENAFNNIIGHILTDNQVNFVKQINSNINIPYYLRINDYNKSYFNSKYFTIIPEKSGVITFNNTGGSGNLYYSKDLGNTWVEMKKVWENGGYLPNTLSVNAYEGIIFKSKIAPNVIFNNDKPYGIGTFSMNVDSQICGNIASLMYEEDFSDKTTMNSTNTYGNFYNFTNLFKGNQNKLDVEKLILPFTSLTQGCYMYMFKDCVKLINTPELPSLSVSNSCYQQMFEGCTSLTTPLSLPASVLTNAQRCYYKMFKDCTSLTTAPELPATTLSGAEYCYSNMFENCISLTESPILRAYEAPEGAYKEMFKGCSSLNKITLLTEYMNSSYSAGSCTANWVEGVSQTGTFIKKANPEKYSTLYNFGYGVDEIPVGWTVQDYVVS